MARAPWALLALVALTAFTPPLCHAALNVDAHAAEDLVRNLRRSIFVETAFLAERPAVAAALGAGTACSSLDGPRCFQAAFSASADGGSGPTGMGPGQASAVLDGPGVVPEMLLRDLGVPGAEDFDFVTPEYSVLEHIRQQHSAMAEKVHAPLLQGAESLRELQRARADVSGGFLHFQGLQPDARLPLSFSRGLPGGVVATWDGRWLVRGCGGGVFGEAPPLALPAPGDEDPNQHGLVVARTGSAVAGGGLPLAAAAGAAPPGAAREALSSSAELAGSVGYIRFSRPVVVRSLFARWTTSQKSPALIGGRLGLESSWATHLEPTRLREGSPGSWLDIAGPLRPVDEIALVGAAGLEVGALEVLAPEASVDDDVRSVLVLAPLDDRARAAAAQAEPAEEEDRDGASAGPRPMFELKVQTVSLAAAPYLASLDEVVQNNLRLLPARRPRGGPHAPALPAAGPSGGLPGVLSAQAPPPAVLVPGDAAFKDAAWLATAAANEEMFRHASLVPLMQMAMASVVATHAPGVSGPVVGADKLMVEASQAVTHYLSDNVEDLPDDLRRVVPREGEEIIEAVCSWIEAGGGWRRQTPSMLPRGGSDDALARYASAKRRQTKLDLLTAMFLHRQQATGFEPQMHSVLRQLQQQWAEQQRRQPQSPASGAHARSS